MVSMTSVTSHITRLGNKEKERECLPHLDTALYTGVNKMNKTSAAVVNIV